MGERETIQIEVGVGELMALINYCNQVADGIPKDIYDVYSLKGVTFGQTVQKYKQRADELYEILSEKWPK